MVKWVNRAAIAFVVVTSVLSAGYALRRDPIFIIPGKQLTGEEQAYPSDWEFSQQYSSVKIEMRPEDPYSVTTSSWLLEGVLHIPAMKGSTKEWPQYVLADPRVRIKIGDAIYPAIATLVSKDTLASSYYGSLFFAEAKKKFLAAGREIPTLEELPEEVWLYEISDRGSISLLQNIAPTNELGVL